MFHLFTIFLTIRFFLLFYIFLVIGRYVSSAWRVGGGVTDLGSFFWGFFVCGALGNSGDNTITLSCSLLSRTKCLFAKKKWFFVVFFKLLVKKKTRLLKLQKAFKKVSFALVLFRRQGQTKKSIFFKFKSNFFCSFKNWARHLI